MVSTIDFRYLSDVLTRDEAIQLLQEKQTGRKERTQDLITNGYRCYTTATGWLGYSDEKMIKLCNEYKSKGFTAFKIKIGQDLEVVEDLEVYVLLVIM